jgi:hypothetical protein
MHRKRSGFVASLLIVTMVMGGCAWTPDLNQTRRVSTAAPALLGRFSPSQDLFFAHFDIRPDVDDLHSIAALGAVLSDPRYARVQYLAVAGTYGTQRGDYIDPPELLRLAFGERWLDAHNARDAALAVQLRAALATLDAGGQIWVMEAGQSDHSAALFARVAAARPAIDVRARVHIVQHSDWNERHTSAASLAWVGATLDYIKIADGNRVGNGTPGYNSRDGAPWPRLFAQRRTGPLWRAAHALAREVNPRAAYRNPTIDADGFDFSDVAEAAHIFGFDHHADAAAFFAEFARE